jgi:CubicO group peptidase (beta-lactamase class C family)
VKWIWWIVVLACVALPRANAQQAAAKPSPADDGRIPVTGKKTRGVDGVDRVMLKYLQKIGCTAATVTVDYRGSIVHSRGYGWSDQAKTIPTRPDTMIGIASCDKPIIAAAVRQLARQRRFGLNTRVFEFLKIEPAGKVVDERIWHITIQNLLEHKAGWQGEPLERALAAARTSGLRDPIPIDVLLKYIMVGELQDAPGTKDIYCNTCYDTLRYIVEKVSGHRAVDYFRTALFHRTEKTELRGFEVHNARSRKGDPPLVWNDGGPTCASAPALCLFMRQFWLTGEPRDRSRLIWQMNGSLPGSTSMMLWRPDGLDLVFLFNGRGDASHEEIKKELEAALRSASKMSGTN